MLIYNIQMLSQTLKTVFHESANNSELDLENKGLNVLLNFFLFRRKKPQLIHLDSEHQF